MVSAEELRRRPTRPVDYAAENQALIALAQELARSPEGILQKLADTALRLCCAHSAGLSLLEEGDGKKDFHWRAIAGQWAPHLNGGTPRNFSPCGTVLDQNAAMICSHPEVDFAYWQSVRPVLEEALLVPFYIKGEAVGTIWVVAHDISHSFDAEDLRVMTSLGAFAATAYHTLLNLNAAQRAASIVECSHDAIIGEDLNGTIISWNRSAERMFGYMAEEVIGKPVTILFPAGQPSEKLAPVEPISHSDRIENCETVRQDKNGRRVDVSSTISPIIDPHGRIIGASSICRDVSERKRVEMRQQLLLAELDHRVKNILYQVSAVVKSSHQGSLTAEAFLQSIDGRIRSMAAAHTLLSQSGWTRVDIDVLVRNQLAPYLNFANIGFGGTDITLGAIETQALARVLHELATNAAKYGALSVPDGRVSVTWDRRSNGNEARLEFEWRESDGPAVGHAKPVGYGTNLIRNLIPHELGGEVDLVFGTNGVTCRIECPVDGADCYRDSLKNGERHA
jgi:PAS domain S-box-containing protein